MKHKKALITGANGFSGKHLIRHLESECVQISTVSLRDEQVTGEGVLAEILGQAQPDYIFHLAGVTSGDSAEDYFRTNVLYAAALLRAAGKAKLGDRPLLLVGTAAEYGLISSDDIPISEETKCHPYNLYGISKLAQTFIGLAAAINDNRRVVVVRPFNIIGSGMPEHLALASFQRQISEIKMGRRSAVLEVGNLAATRDFIDIEDVVRLYWTLIQNERAYGEIFNLCTGIPTSIGTLLDLLIEASGIHIEVRTDEKRRKVVDIPVHFGNNHKLHQLIGNVDYTAVETTVRKLVL